MLTMPTENSHLRKVLQVPQRDTPRAEYPRPDLVRDGRWFTLNGEWEFLPDDNLGFDEADDLPTPPWAHQIVVPFAWETAASRIGRTWLERGWYRRTVVVPPDWPDKRVFLRFGAVHHAAFIWLDGIPVGSHEGGYTPFEFDITDHVTAGRPAQLVVRVDAPSDKRSIVHGKQRSLPPDDYDDVAFTPTSGIWQSVWIEQRPPTWLGSLSIRGDSLTGFQIDARVDGDRGVPVTLTVAVSGADTPVEATLPVSAAGSASGFIVVESPRLWSPADPYLYQVTVRVTTEGGADIVHASAGLRRFEARGEAFYLNGDRCYLRGVLDQGYWPATGMTAPTAEALYADLELALGAGYNLVRKHLKLEDPVWLHAADRLGMLVWEEPACASRFRPEAIAAFEDQIPAMVERDGSHPSIVIWGLYNEEWGLDWDVARDPDKAAVVVRAYERLKELDPTRPIVDNSGWAHVRTDIVDWHHYVTDPRLWKDTVAAYAAGKLESIAVPLGDTESKDIYAIADHPRDGVPFMNSEYGTGYTSLQRGWQLRWQTQELRRHDRNAGYVYCELADVEHETAGLLYADRQAKDLGGLDPADINAESTLVFDVDPVQPGIDVVARPGDQLALPVRISHHGGEPLRAAIAAAWIAPGAPLPRGCPTATYRSDEFTVLPFRLSDPYELAVTVPAATARLYVWAEHGGSPVARGFVDVGYIEVPPWKWLAKPAD